MVIFRIYHFSRFQRGSNILQGGPTFSRGGGSNCLFPIESKYWCKDQESIQSSTTPDPGYQWESDKLTVDTANESQEVSPFPAGDHKARINRRAQRQQDRTKT